MAESVDGHLIYKGFEAWIDVDNEPLPHFGAEHNEPTNEASAWIPSEAGKRFRVYYRKMMQDENGYRARLYLDGRAADMRVHCDANRITNVKKMSCVEVSPTETRYFVFNSIALTDDDEFLDDPSSAAIGEIKLILKPAKPRNAPPKPVRFHDIQPETQKVHERSGKGLVHQIKFSESTFREYCAPFEIAIESVGEPVTFIFKYRSLDILQANGIAPCPAAPAEAEEDDPESPRAAQASVKKLEEEDAKPELGTFNGLKQEDEDEDDEEDQLVDDDDDEIVRREQALMAELEEVRNQKRAREQMRPPARRVKTEPIIHFQPGEVIDFTTEPEITRARKRVKTEFTRRKFIHGAVIDLT